MQGRDFYYKLIDLLDETEVYIEKKMGKDTDKHFDIVHATHRFDFLHFLILLACIKTNFSENV